MIKPQKISFEDKYSDDSGVEFGVAFDDLKLDDEITFERIDKVSFPMSRLDWLIDCLIYIKEQTK